MLLKSQSWSNIGQPSSFFMQNNWKRVHETYVVQNSSNCSSDSSKVFMYSREKAIRNWQKRKNMPICWDSGKTPKFLDETLYSRNRTKRERGHSEKRARRARQRGFMGRGRALVTRRQSVRARRNRRWRACHAALLKRLMLHEWRTKVKHHLRGRDKDHHHHYHREREREIWIND